MSGVALTPLDADLKIDWPIQIDPGNLEQISEKDSRAPRLREILNFQKEV